MSTAVLDHLRRTSAIPLPAYVTDHAALAAHAAAVRAALPPSIELLYAAKADPDRAVLQTLRPYLDGVEVASGGELRHVAAAVPDLPLSFGGPGKTGAELALAARSGVHRLHVESERELRALAALATPNRPLDVQLRVNAPRQVPGAPLAMGGGPSPFGLGPVRLGAAAREVTESPGLRLRGLHLHLASAGQPPGRRAAADLVRRWRHGGRPVRARAGRPRRGGGRPAPRHFPGRPRPCGRPAVVPVDLTGILPPVGDGILQFGGQPVGAGVLDLAVGRGGQVIGVREGAVQRAGGRL